MKKPKLQTIRLGNKPNGTKIIIDHNSKHECSKCKTDIFKAVLIKEEKQINIELISLAVWDIHKCKIK